MKITYFASLLLVGGISLTACKKEGCTDPLADNYDENAKKEDSSCVYTNDNTSVDVYFDHKWGMMASDFAMNTELVHPMTEDTLTFNNFKYYVSNFQLKNENGEWWIHPESYFLLDLSDGVNAKITIDDVPQGTYTEMKYVLGVDSARNVSGAQDGALSVANNMFWSWTTGYIMLKAEGTSPQSGTGNFSFHLGGFEGDFNVVTEKSAAFGATALIVDDQGTSEVHMVANPAKLWHGSPSVSEVSMTHMPGETAVTMTSNFYGNVALDYVQNN